MPYIKQEHRDKYDQDIACLKNTIRRSGVSSPWGHLNYIITKLLKDFGVDYDSYNSCVGVLECVKQELYRKVIAEYEDRKEQENGEVL